MKTIIKWFCILVVIAFAFTLFGCEEDKVTQVDLMESHIYNIKVIDSCEYISVSASRVFNGLTHKGNCRFCKERRQKELKELVEQLNENNYGNN